MDCTVANMYCMYSTGRHCTDVMKRYWITEYSRGLDKSKYVHRYTTCVSLLEFTEAKYKLSWEVKKELCRTVTAYLPKKKRKEKEHVSSCREQCVLPGKY